MNDNNQFVDIGIFLGEYAAHLMGCGVHTSRVIRNTKRLSDAFGLDVTVSLFQKTLTLSIYDINKKKIHSELVEIKHGPIIFAHNSELSALSWEAYDKHLSLEEVKSKYQKICRTGLLNKNLVLILASLANMSFCKLFGGTPTEMFWVLIGTAAGFFLKRKMSEWKCNGYLTIIASAFIASMISAASIYTDPGSHTAFITSVLYLIPGVPLINGTMDIIEGYTLMGITRLINAFLIVLCIAVGLGTTLTIFLNNLIY